MLTEMSTENIKAFRDVTSVPLGPMTLLYGPNSGGKSTLLQSLLLFTQTICRARTNSLGGMGLETLATKGPWVDVGSEMSLVYGHDKRRTLGVGVAWSAGDDEAGYIALHSTFRWARASTRPTLWETRLQ